MDIQQQANIFRMSATLFANNNYQISPVQLHRKVVEDALFTMNSGEGVTLEALAEYIEREYFFNFDESELRKVLHDSKFGQYFEWKSSAHSDTRYMLKKERREQLSLRTTKTLNDFIGEYLTLKGVDLGKAESIYKYLYGVFTTNVDSFKRMLEVGSSKSLTEYYAPQEQDIDLINGFLDWENEQKNIAIFNLASYALEFCLLTSKKDSSLKLDSLKHKIFYLDTNILYRAIGINGEDRKSRSLSFLHKLKESESEIRISKVTWDEFEGSLNNYIKKLRKSETPAIRSKVYTEFITYDDIYRYYHLWASKRANATIDLFVDWMKASMKSLVEDFEIEIVKLIPFSLERQKERLNEMAAQIAGFGKGKLFDTAFTDACNILWVDNSRKPGENTLFSTKTFLISSDHGLYVWDARYNSKDTPIVIMPSQWLSLLLRYVARSNDDYRSFVCFLNIQDKEGVLSSEQINAILTGIAEMTDNVEQQKHFLETIIEREFKDGAGGKTNDQLKAIARNESERMLQKQVDDIKSAHEELKASFSGMQQQFDKHKAETQRQLAEKDRQLEEANAKIDQLESNVHGLGDDSKESRHLESHSDPQKDLTIQQLEAELSYERGKARFERRKRREVAWKSIGVAAVCALVIWFFCSSSVSNNLMGGLLRWIDTLETTQQYVARGVLVLVFSFILFPLSISLGKSICSKYEKNKINS